MPDGRSFEQLSRVASKIGANLILRVALGAAVSVERKGYPSQACRACGRRLSRRVERDKFGAKQRFWQWLASSLIVPLVLGLMSLVGAIWVVNNSKLDDCFHRDEEILRIYDEHPEEYKVLVSEQDSLAGTCAPAAVVLNNAHPRPTGP
jgi:hypothetical protein